MTDSRSDCWELLKLLKQQATLPAQAEQDEAALERIQALSTAALSALGSDAAATAAAVATPDRDQLLELLFSTMKVVEAGGFQDIDYGEVQHGDAWAVAAARVAAGVLQGSSSDGGGESSGALDMLAWLVLFGRCCRYLHRHLQKSECSAMFFPQGYPAGGGMPPLGRPGVDWYRLWEGCPGVFIAKKPSQLQGDAEGEAAEDAPAAAAEGEAAVPPATTTTTISSSSSSDPQFASWLAALTAWLQDSGTSAQLAAAGLSTEGLLQRLERTALALRCLQRLSASNPIDLMGSVFTMNLGDGGGVGVQQEQHLDRDKQLGVRFLASLGDLGTSLAVLPLSCCCNNPSCQNLEGVGEEAGLQGSLCAACRKARYCSKGCQKQHWKQHRLVCKALAEAAAGAVPPA